jgi:non-specific serine/threonine protein kinase
MLDPAAKAAYRERLEQMRAEVEEATALNDLGRAERAREEMEVLMQQLAGAIGLGNRDRKIPSNAERSRVAVTKAVTLALRTIGEANPSLRRYLAGTIKTGQFCSYTPDPRFPVTWRLE